MSSKNQPLLGPYIPCPIKRQRPLHPAVIVTIYALALGLFSLLMVTARLPDSLLILFVVPVVTVPLFSYNRWVYLPMEILLTGAAVWVTSILSRDFRASLWTIAFSVTSSLTMAEIVHFLVRSRRRAEESLRESQQMLQLIMNHIPQAIFWKDTRSVYLGCNRAFADDAGLGAPEEVVGKNDWEMPWVKQADRCRSDDHLVMQTNQPKLDYEEPQTTPTGSQTWLKTSKIPLHDTGGNVIAVLGIYEDITARKEAEAALRASEDKYRQLFEMESDALFLIDNETRQIVEANSAASALYGHSREELLQKRNTDLSAQPAETRKATEEGRTQVPVRYHRKKDGTIFPVEITGRHFNWQGRPVHIAAIRDITTRQRDEERIVHLNTVLRAIRNVNQLITHERDRSRLLQGICDSLIETRGYYYAWIVLTDPTGKPALFAEAGLSEKPLARQLHTGQLPRCIEQALAQPNLLVFQSLLGFYPECPPEWTTSNTGILARRLYYEGQVFGALSVSLPAHLAADAAEQDLFQEVAADISFALHSIEQEEGRQQAEEALTWQANVNATTAELAKALLASPSIEDISSLVFEDARLLTDSPLGFVGYTDQLTGHLICPTTTKDMWDVCQIEDKDVRFKEFKGLWGWVASQRQPVLTNHPEDDPRSTDIPQGHIPIRRFLSVPALADGKLVGQIALANAQTDYTERDLLAIQRLADAYAIAIQRKWLEEQLLQSQKMEAIGRLAGGVAHDFNNHLTAINGYSDLLLDELPLDDPLRADVEEIKKAAERSASLTRQLLAFSRKQVLELQVLDLNEIVTQMENMLQRLIGENIHMHFNLVSQLTPIRADPGQIEQVILNLAVNAHDAMPNGGNLTIQTGQVNADEVQTPYRSLIHPGKYATLSVCDDGIGMDEETISHLFEPFFTTKPKGKGTGLGLATAYGIVKQSGGYIFPESAPGQGTIFTVYLPAIEPETASEELGQTSAPSSYGTETILLVEDGDAVRALARRILQRQGYIVLEACDAAEALGLCEQYKGTIDLILTDVIMPGNMDGHMLAEHVVRGRSETRVLYMSGYTEDVIAHYGILDPGVHFIAKPFTAESLVRQVREVLDSE